MPDVLAYAELSRCPEAEDIHEIGHVDRLDIPGYFRGSDDQILIESRVGAPIINDTGRNRLIAPVLTKTVTREVDSGGLTYFAENLHMLMPDGKHAPIRSKLHHGESVSAVSHLPTLALARGSLWQMGAHIADVRDDISTMTLNAIYDRLSSWDRHHTDEAIDELATTSQFATTIRSDLSSDPTQTDSSTLVENLIKGAGDGTQFKTVMEYLKPPHHPWIRMRTSDPVFLKEKALYPGWGAGYASFDFDSKLDLSTIPNLKIGDWKFSKFVHTLDTLPITDLNTDIVLGAHGRVIHRHIGCLRNQVSVYERNHVGLQTLQEAVIWSLNGPWLMDLLRTICSMWGLGLEHIPERLPWEPVKIKIIKTFRDEILFLLYPGNSTETAEPLGGVYLDAGLLALSPLSIGEVHYADY